MKQKEERDLENALAWDDTDVDMDTILEAAKVDKEESDLFFKEVGQNLVRGAILLEYRRKRVHYNLAKHWFIYEHPDKKEIRLLTSDQKIEGEKYRFIDVQDELIFSY